MTIAPETLPDDAERFLASLTRLAYDAYGQHVGWRNYQDQPMPEWEALPPKIRGAWRAATASTISVTLARVGTAFQVLADEEKGDPSR